MSIVFESQIDFERAVMECLKEHLHMQVVVEDAGRSKFSGEKCVSVKVALTSEYDGEIASDEDTA